MSNAKNKILTGLLVIGVFLTTAILPVSAQVGSVSYFKKTGSTVQLLNDAWTLQANSAAFASVSIGGIASGNLDLNGQDLLNIGTATTSELVATSGITLGGVRMTSWPSGGSGGGSSAWTTTTGRLYPNTITDTVLIGRNTTTTDGTILEVDNGDTKLATTTIYNQFAGYGASGYPMFLFNDFGGYWATTTWITGQTAIFNIANPIGNLTPTFALESNGVYNVLEVQTENTDLLTISATGTLYTSGDVLAGNGVFNTVTTTNLVLNGGTLSGVATTDLSDSADIGRLSSGQTWTGANVFTATSTFSFDLNGVGPDFYYTSSSPAVLADGGYFTLSAKNSADEKVTQARVKGVFVDGTDGLESSGFVFGTYDGGVFADSVLFATSDNQVILQAGKSFYVSTDGAGTTITLESQPDGGIFLQGATTTVADAFVASSTFQVKGRILGYQEATAVEDTIWQTKVLDTNYLVPLLDGTQNTLYTFTGRVLVYDVSCTIGNAAGTAGTIDVGTDANALPIGANGSAFISALDGNSLGAQERTTVAGNAAASGILLQNGGTLTIQSSTDLSSSSVGPLCTIVYTNGV